MKTDAFLFASGPYKVEIAKQSFVSPTKNFATHSEISASPEVRPATHRNSLTIVTNQVTNPAEPLATDCYSRAMIDTRLVMPFHLQTHKDLWRLQVATDRRAVRLDLGPWSATFADDPADRPYLGRF